MKVWDFAFIPYAEFLLIEKQLINCADLLLSFGSLG
jgi:hypothetical protein